MYNHTKLSFIALFSFLFAATVSAQTEKKDSVRVTPKVQNRPSYDKPDEKGIYQVAQKMPFYQGGDKAMLQVIGSNLKYPVLAQENGVQGTVIIRFVVNKNGEAEKPEVLRSLEPACDKEALRVVKLLNNWIPGEQNGEKVSVYWTLPIKFKLFSNEKTPKTSDNNAIDKDKLVDRLEQMPRFPGGEAAMLQFMASNQKYPKQAKDAKIQGTVMVKFVVTKQGKVERAEILRSLSPECDSEALRVVSLFPTWTPGMQNGEPVAVQYTLPFRFKL